MLRRLQNREMLSRERRAMGGKKMIDKSYEFWKKRNIFEMEYFILIEKFSDHIYDGEEDCDIEEREKVLIGE